MFNWIILAQHHGGVTRLLPDPAGGMTLQYLPVRGESQTLVLDVDAGQALCQWAASQPHAIPEATVDDALYVLASNGYGVVPPPAPQAGYTLDLEPEPPSTEAKELAQKVAAAALQAYSTRHTPSVADFSETVADYCRRINRERSEETCLQALTELLREWHVPADGLYPDWSTELARVSLGRYPEEVNES